MGTTSTYNIRSVQRPKTNNKFDEAIDWISSKIRPAIIWSARTLVVLFLTANALANIIHWFDGKHVDHQMAIGAGVVTLGVCLYIYFIKK